MKPHIDLGTYKTIPQKIRKVLSFDDISKISGGYGNVGKYFTLWDHFGGVFGVMEYIKETKTWRKMSREELDELKQNTLI